MAEQTGAMNGAAVSAGRREMRAWFWAMLHNSYVYGLSWYDTSGWDRYAGWRKTPKPADGSVGWAMVAGFLFAAFLQAMRVRFFWWPFHP